MRKYSFKPLILLVICLLALFLLLGAELVHKKVRPDESKKTAAKSTSLKGQKQKKEKKDQKPDEESDKAADQTGQPESTSREIYGDAPIELTMAVGTIGSVEEGGFAWIYEDADEESTPMWKLQYNCAVKILEDYDDDWYCVDISGDGGMGYVKKEECRPVEVTIGCYDNLRDKIVKAAYSYLGLGFKRYGTSLTEGIDCSNFVQQIYNIYGVTIPNVPLKQRDFGRQVRQEEALPGDLVFYDKANNGTGHVALYLGDGMMINSSGHSGSEYPRGGVRICCLTYKDRDSYQFYNMLDSSGQEGQGK